MSSRSLFWRNVVVVSQMTLINEYILIFHLVTSIPSLYLSTTKILGQLSHIAQCPLDDHALPKKISRIIQCPILNFLPSGVEPFIIGAAKAPNELIVCTKESPTVASLALRFFLLLSWAERLPCKTWRYENWKQKRKWQIECEWIPSHKILGK